MLFVFPNAGKIRPSNFILGILENEFGLAGLSRPDLDAIGQASRAPGGFWLAVDAGKIVGTAGLLDAGQSRGYLKRWYVEKSRRGHGIGSQLFDCVFAHARKNNFSRIFIATEPTMKRIFSFYGRSGFRRIADLP